MDPEPSRRIQLQTLLESVLGTNEVYFQPPANVQMKYPAITYMLDLADTKFAGNIPYLHKKRYQVTIIDGNPDSDIPDKIAALPLCLFDRMYTADNLYHYVYNLYF